MPDLVQRDTAMNNDKLSPAQYAFSAYSNTDSMHASDLSKTTLALDMDRLGHKLFPEALVTPTGSTLVGSPELKGETAPSGFDSVGTTSSSFSFGAGSPGVTNSVRTSDASSKYSEWKATDLD
jgi:hypothetical protein